MTHKRLGLREGKAPSGAAEEGAEGQRLQGAQDAEAS